MLIIFLIGLLVIIIISVIIISVSKTKSSNLTTNPPSTIGNTSTSTSTSTSTPEPIATAFNIPDQMYINPLEFEILNPSSEMAIVNSFGTYFTAHVSKTFNFYLSIHMESSGSYSFSLYKNNILMDSTETNIINPIITPVSDVFYVNGTIDFLQGDVLTIRNSSGGPLLASETISPNAEIRFS